MTGPPPRFADILSLRSLGSPAPSVRIRKDPKYYESRVPHPSHRHASPSAPWPWVDIEDEVDSVQLECPFPPIPPLCSHQEADCDSCWRGYPQSRFPNWTHRQVIKSKIYGAICDYNKESPCVLHRVDVDENGFFTNPGPIVAKSSDERHTWETLIEEKRPAGIRVRAMFIENMSGPILQMLGAKYNIEPYFWSSSLSWIPSRFQEEIQPAVGDHITITLTFLRSMSNFDAVQLNGAFGKSTDSLNPPSMLVAGLIDAHAPLSLHSNDRVLVLDLLAVHLIRNINGSTIISLHPTLNLPTTTAPFLHERIRFAGQSVGWQRIFQKSPDPTFVLLTFIWHAMYAWDEALENLYSHICSLEAHVLTTAEIPLTRELHIIRAHQLNYVSLLEDLSKHIKFIRNTYNPIMEGYTEEDRTFSETIMDREISALLGESSRLHLHLEMQAERLKNIQGLVTELHQMASTKAAERLAEATMRDSAIMTQIGYLTMLFLPASFIASVFGMNVYEINPGSTVSLSRYLCIALPFTIFTVWIAVAFQSRRVLPSNQGFYGRLGWPVHLAIRIWNRKRHGVDPIIV